MSYSHNKGFGYAIFDSDLSLDTDSGLKNAVSIVSKESENRGTPLPGFVPISWQRMRPLNTAEGEQTGAEQAKCEMPTLEEVLAGMAAKHGTSLDYQLFKSGAEAMYDYISRRFAR